MFELPVPFGKRLRELRERLSLTQTQLARLIAVPRAVVCDYEAGRRQPDRAGVEALSSILRGCVIAGTDWGSARPAWRARQNALLRNLRQTPPPIPPPELPARAHYAAAQQRFPHLVPELVYAIQSRPDAAEVEEHLGSLRLRSGSEGMIPLIIAASGGLPIACRLPTLGLTQHPMVHVVSNRPTGHLEWPGFYLKRGAREICFFSDVGVRTPTKGYTMDFWCHVREPRRDWLLDLEVDGGGHISQWDLKRREHLGYVEVRLNDEDLGSAIFWEIFDRKFAKATAQNPVTPY